MIDYNVKKGPPLNLTLKQEITLTKIISEIIIENNFKCIAYNICKDHIHLIIVCNYDRLNKIVQIIKGKSSYLFKRSKNNDSIEKLWSQKFFRAYLDVWKLAKFSNKTGYIYKSSHLENAINYIKNNRLKHELPISKELNKIVNTFVINQEIAFSI